MVDKATKQIKLEEISSAIISAKICADLAATATNLVFGDGNPDADIVFIGEAPGKNEDLTGKPFVGAAGKFLGEMLEGIGMNREDVYITNIVKYRPPNNRDPLPEEKAAFMPYLIQQLQVIGPKLIVTLGRHSMEAMLPGLKISQVHGQPKRIRIQNLESRMEDTSKFLFPDSQFSSQDSWVILPLFHPAAALYNGSLRQTLIDDFRVIPRLLNKIDN